MGTILSLLKRIEQVDINSIAEASIESVKEEIADKNKEQLKKGYNKFGELIGDTKPYESELYAFEKYNKNPMPGLGNPDLHDTGDFYEGITTEVSNGIIKTESTDSKNEELQAKYKGILSLNEESRIEIVDESLRPAMVKEFKQQTKL